MDKEALVYADLQGTPYLTNNVSEGLKPPAKMLRASAPKLVATLEQYAEAWSLLEERERLCFDLVMFAGMRESEAFAIWWGDWRKTESISSGDFIRAPMDRRRRPKATELLACRMKSWSACVPGFRAYR